MATRSKTLLRAIIPVLVGLVIAIIPCPSGLTQNAWYYFALFAAVIAGVILEPIPAAAVGLIGITVAATFGLVYQKPVDAIKWALSGFSDTTVWLIFGAFMYTLGFKVSGLGRRIALLFVKYLGKDSLRLGYSIALTDLVLAPFTPSNTARSGGIVYPVIRHIPEIYGSQPGPTARKIGSYIMWTAFATTCVTSTMFLTGLAPNLLLLTLARKTLNIEIGWLEWFIAFLPMSLLLFIATPLLAYKLYPPELKKSPEAPKWAEEELRKIGRVSTKEIFLMAIVILALALWIAGGELINATTVALIGVILMLLLKVVEWSDVISYKEAWNILMWFATLVTMADGLARVGFISWFVNVIKPTFQLLPLTTAIILVITVFWWLHYLFASLTAHVTAMFPVFVAVLTGLGIPPKAATLLLGGTIGFMGIISPYATGPAPVYYGCGYIESKKFWQLGFIFGLIFFIVYIVIGIPWILTLFKG